MYPEFADKCANDLLHDLTYNLREGYIEPEDDDVTLAPAITLPSITEETSDEQDSVSGDDVSAAGSDGENGPPMNTSRWSGGNDVGQDAGGGGGGGRGVGGGGILDDASQQSLVKKTSPTSPTENLFR